METEMPSQVTQKHPLLIRIRPRVTETIYLGMILVSIIGFTYEWFHR